jgi:hypothetical protein
LRRLHDGEDTKMTAENTRADTLNISALQEDAQLSEAGSGTGISAAQIDLVYTQAPVALGSALAVAALMSLGLWGVADHDQLLLWVSLQLLQTTDLLPGI